jgi:hypothetical protein
VRRHEPPRDLLTEAGFNLGRNGGGLIQARLASLPSLPSPSPNLPQKPSQDDTMSPSSAIDTELRVALPRHDLQSTNSELFHNRGENGGGKTVGLLQQDPAEAS